MALQLEVDEARRDMYLLLRATEFERGSERITRAERIHEALFVLWSRRGLAAGDFEIKRDGCRSPSLAHALEEAVRSGEVVHETDAGLDTYSLTDSGIAAAGEAWDAAGIDERADASEAKYAVSGISGRELASFLYAAFPEVWNDPAARAEAARGGFDAACSMYDKGKITISRAASMAGMGYEEFMRAFQATGKPLSG
ncbi:hypothetical protein IBTHAUMO2_320039 [Nitrosopumilaceae archaeon]|nr:hypothetical protein [Nitrosopumilus sp.]MDA7945031.1 hypothetical protein [Nitrosopumilus sp.]MDA7954389.1 hypothetical protein [Nitrosopumilus sp.]MDA7997801.1 hypothetical protein [Nitrosopumilus sp.]CAI9831613.1 hypothetical protein IBTHAUMO2_320039 [Nitrosopumilaceae archaeon]